MTDRERQFAALGLEYAEGIDLASVVTLPSGREVRKTDGGKWEAQPWNDNHWREFDDLLAACEFATPPKTQDAPAPSRCAEFRLTRTGKPALVFAGELIAGATSFIPVNGGALQNRWHELAVYRTAGGKWVAAVGFRSCWQGEHDHDAAEIFARPDQLVSWLLRYSPRDHWLGYPAGAAYAERQARIEAEIRGGYERAVSALLAGLPEADERVR